MHLSEMRILFVTQSLELGGTEKQIVALVKGLSRQGISSYIFSFQKDGALKGEIQPDRVRLFSGGLSKGDLSKISWKIVAAQWKLMRCIREVKPTVLHAYLPLTTFLGAVAARLAGIDRIIISKRALGTHQDRRPILRGIDRMANALSDVITVNSKAVWQDTIERDRLIPSKLRIIYNGIDSSQAHHVSPSDRRHLKATLKVSKNETIILNIANYIPYKGHIDLLRAAALVLQEKPLSKFLLVGEDRGQLEHLRAVASELGIQDRVLFLGQRKDINALLAISDILVVASHEEGFSNAILEAMAAGLPVVATAVGGNPEAVMDGTTGWLVPPHKPDRLAFRMLTLLNDSDQVRKLGAKGCIRSQNYFSMQRMVENHLNLYQKKTKQGSSGGHHRQRVL